MTREIIEIKAMSLEEAKKRAMKVLDIQENQIFNIIEKVKGKSFFGLFAKEGVYEIEYTEEEIETPKEKKVEKEKTEKVEKSKFGVGRDLRKEREEKKKEAKKKQLQNGNEIEVVGGNEKRAIGAYFKGQNNLIAPKITQSSDNTLEIGRASCRERVSSPV